MARYVKKPIYCILEGKSMPLLELREIIGEWFELLPMLNISAEGGWRHVSKSDG